MGPAGAGKTTVGQALAAALRWRFLDADDHHSLANRAKMQAGEGLTDADRDPWLRALRAEIDEALAERRPTVIACSALKRSYRDALGHDRPRVRMVYLRGSARLLRERVIARREHFAGEALVPGQLKDLEEPDPDEALTLDASAPVASLVSGIRDAFSL